ncbi:MAG: hypothetical protein ABIO37_08160 [Caulobacteraceae bacterium]
MLAPAEERRRLVTQGRIVAVNVSVAVHMSLFLALLWTRTVPPTPVNPFPMTVSMIDAPLLVPEPKPPPKAAPAPTEKPPVPLQIAARKTPQPVRPKVEPLPAGEVTKGEISSNQLSDGQLAGATTAESGPSGRNCNMVRMLQAALRKNPTVAAAVAAAHRDMGGARAITMWNGDWVRNNGEDGAGLAGVREAMMLGIAFAPEPCRSEPVRGSVLISLNDSPGSARLALGSGEWRWSDLLTPRRNP